MDDFDPGPESACRGVPAYLVGDWLDSLRTAPNRTWGIAMALLVENLAKQLRGVAGADPEDIAQGVVLRLLERNPPAHLGWPREARLAAWLRGVARHAALTWRRRLRAGMARDLDGVPVARPSRRPSGLAELVVEIAELPSRLPQPHGWILARLLAGDTTAEIAEGLRAWRGIGPDGSRLLVREAKRAARSVLDGDEDAFRALLSRQKKKKNPWDITPPPPN